MSTRILSPSRTKAIGPASTASGAMCPMHGRCCRPRIFRAIRGGCVFNVPVLLLTFRLDALGADQWEALGEAVREAARELTRRLGGQPA